MPSEKILSEKQKIVDDLAQQLKSASSVVLVDYKGITVADDTKLRTTLRKANVHYFVQKNTLLSLAAKKAGLEGLDVVLKGSTAVAISETDLVAPAKILNEYAAGSKDKFKIKAGAIEGQTISAAQVVDLAKLPPKEQLIAKVLGGFNAPIAGFANVLSANLSGLVRVLNAYAEKQSA